MYKWPYAPWIQASVEAWTLGMEASAVIALRTTKIAAGGIAAQREAQLMLTEKLGAALELQTALVTGRLGTSPVAATRKALRHYGRKVRANRRRLG